jgi:hypothetical protein
MIFKSVKKMHPTEYFSAKKCTSASIVLIDEKLDETGARSEHSPHKSLTQVSQQLQVSMKTARRQLKGYI